MEESRQERVLRALERIAEKYLHQLSRRAELLGVHLEFSEDLVVKLGRRCKQKEGARQLRRMLQEELESPLAALLLRSAKKPGKVYVSAENDALALHF